MAGELQVFCVRGRGSKFNLFLVNGVYALEVYAAKPRHRATENKAARLEESSKVQTACTRILELICVLVSTGIRGGTLQEDSTYRLLQRTLAPLPTSAWYVGTLRARVMYMCVCVCVCLCVCGTLDQ